MCIWEIQVLLKTRRCSLIKLNFLITKFIFSFYFILFRIKMKVQTSKKLQRLILNTPALQIPTDSVYDSKIFVNAWKQHQQAIIIYFILLLFFFSLFPFIPLALMPSSSSLCYYFSYSKTHRSLIIIINIKYPLKKMLLRRFEPSLT